VDSLVTPNSQLRKPWRREVNSLPTVAELVGSEWRFQPGLSDSITQALTSKPHPVQVIKAEIKKLQKEIYFTPYTEINSKGS